MSYKQRQQFSQKINNKRSKSSHQQQNEKDIQAQLKLTNHNNNSSFHYTNNLNTTTFGKISKREANQIIQNINRKSQTPSLDITKKLANQNFTTKNNTQKYNQTNKNLFSSINKNLDKESPIRKSSKSVYNTINYNQQCLNQSQNNPSALKKYLNLQQQNYQTQKLNSSINPKNMSGHQRTNSRKNNPLSTSIDSSLYNNNNLKIPQKPKKQFLKLKNANNDENYIQAQYKVHNQRQNSNKFIQNSSSQKNNNLNNISVQSYNNNANNSSLLVPNQNFNNSVFSTKNMQSLTSQSIHNNSSNQQLQNQQPTPQQLKMEQAKKHFSQGKKYFRSNQLQNAIDCFQKSISIEPDMLDSQYLIGVCYLSSQDYSKSIREFNILLEKSKVYKQNVYLLLSIAYKKKNEVQNAISILGEAIKYFPNYYDSYIYRGKLLVKIKQYSQAIQDFEIAINLDQTKALGFIGRADCLRNLQQYEEAVQFYKIAMEIDPNVRKTALLKRAITYSENNEIDKSLEDLQLILDEDPCNSEANFFKGLQYQKQNNFNNATLAFEQSIKHNNSKKAVTKSLYELAKIKIQQRDFYQAFYTLQRSEFLDVDQETLKPFKIFTDSVTYLMKRKYQEGVDNLNQLVKIVINMGKSQSQEKSVTQNLNASMDLIGSGRNSNSQQDLLKQMIYNYRSYGLFCLGQHQKALQDLQTAEQQNNGLELPCQYNKLILQGILAINEFKYDEGFDFFKQASFLQEKKMEPYMYKAMGLIHQAKHKIPESDKQKKLQYFNNALLIMEKAESINKQNAVLFYARSILHFSLGNLEEAMKDIEQSIEKSEDNIASFFYTRGLIQASGLNYKAALQDFSITINLDEKFIQAYINRAKCYYLLEDRQAAFHDLQKCLSLKPDKQIHMHVGNLLFSIGAHEDAVKEYTHLGNIENNPTLLQLRINCYVASKELNSALNDMEKIINLNGSLEVKFDFKTLTAIKIASQANQGNHDQYVNCYIECLELLKECNQQYKLNNNKQGVIFSRSDLKFYQGLFYFYLQQFDKSLKKFNKSIDTLKNQPHKNINIEEIIEEYRFENLTYNIYEFQFNAAICYIMAEQYEEAFKLLEQIEDIIPEGDKPNLRKLISALEMEIDDIQKNEQDEDKEKQEDEDTKIEYQYLDIFPTHNRLCSIFPEIQLPLKKSKIGLRLSFCLPCVPAPSMEPSFDQSLVDKLQPSIVENKPEAPWIKKNAMGVIFTDNILDSNYDLDFTETQRTQREDEQEQEQEEEQNEEQKQLEDMINNDSYYEYDEDNDQNINKEDKLLQFKKEMQLDSNIEEKLKKLQKNKIS